MNEVERIRDLISDLASKEPGRSVAIVSASVSGGARNFIIQAQAAEAFRLEELEMAAIRLANGRAGGILDDITQKDFASSMQEFIALCGDADTLPIPRKKEPFYAGLKEHKMKFKNAGR